MLLIKEYGHSANEEEKDIFGVMWADIEINGYTTYVYGDDDLLEALLEAGFKYDTKRT